jgi:hypothetical protein
MYFDREAQDQSLTFASRRFDFSFQIYHLFMYCSTSRQHVFPLEISHAEDIAQQHQTRLACSSLLPYLLTSHLHSTFELINRALSSSKSIAMTFAIAPCKSLTQASRISFPRVLFHFKETSRRFDTGLDMQETFKTIRKAFDKTSGISMQETF